MLHADYDALQLPKQSRICYFRSKTRPQLKPPFPPQKIKKTTLPSFPNYPNQPLPLTLSGGVDACSAQTQFYNILKFEHLKNSC